MTAAHAGQPAQHPGAGRALPGSPAAAPGHPAPSASLPVRARSLSGWPPAPANTPTTSFTKCMPQHVHVQGCTQQGGAPPSCQASTDPERSIERGQQALEKIQSNLAAAGAWQVAPKPCPPEKTSPQAHDHLHSSVVLRQVSELGVAPPRVQQRCAAWWPVQHAHLPGGPLGCPPGASAPLPAAPHSPAHALLLNHHTGDCTETSTACKLGGNGRCLQPRARPSCQAGWQDEMGALAKFANANVRRSRGLPACTSQWLISHKETRSTSLACTSSRCWSCRLA